MTTTTEQVTPGLCSSEVCMTMRRVLASVGVDELRWAWCPSCLRAHCLGVFVLDEWEPEAEVAWPCPHPDSPEHVIAVDPLFWDDNPRAERWRKRKGRA